MTITREREPHRAERPPGGGGHPCAGQRPHPGVRHLCADHAGTGRKQHKLSKNKEALTRDVVPYVSASFL